jgi:mono/diheme cytochrome c family protein
MPSQPEQDRFARINSAIYRFIGSPLLLAAIVFAGFAYVNYKFFDPGPQDVCGDLAKDSEAYSGCRQNLAEEQFKYGSMNAENDRGIPYPIFYVLPRVFPQCLPGGGVGGYRALGIPWEEGRELPVGFSKRKLGFERVTQTCAVCHAASYRMNIADKPTIVPTGPSHTTHSQEFLRFLACAIKDEDFSFKGMWQEIKREFDMGLDDWAIYALLIPVVRMRIQQQVDGFSWTDSCIKPDADHGDKVPGENTGVCKLGVKRPDWGPGRDDPMNLTKFFLLDADRRKDMTTGNADFPAIWDLSSREAEFVSVDEKTSRRGPHALNFGGETLDPLAVIMDSALGLGAPPGPHFEKQMREIRAYLQRKKPPPYPWLAKVNADDAREGAKLYKRECADCHEAGGRWYGKAVPIEMIGTDRTRFDTWAQEDADGANNVAEDIGANRRHMVKNIGYVAGPLSGVWLKAPYLHNGGVANMKELLTSPAQRRPSFWRGCDLYDDANMGFVSQFAKTEPLAERQRTVVGYRETRTRGARGEIIREEILLPPHNLQRGFVGGEESAACPTIWLQDSRVPGDGNHGHDYGTGLSETEKRQLIAYLKTL